MKPKNLVITAAVMAALGLTTLGVTAIHAATTTSASASPMSSLVTAIAQKFNLNVSDVQQVFDDQKTQMDAQRQQAEADRLAKDVTDGKLTQAQADLITAKKAELEASHQSMDGKTDAERKTAMDAERASLQKWATDNNIPMEYLMFGGHGGPGKFGGHGPEGSHWQESGTTNSTSTGTTAN